jgi:hypothetical protein
MIVLFDANLTYLLNICHAGKDFFYTVHFERHHAVFQCSGQQLRYARMLLGAAASPRPRHRRPMGSGHTQSEIERSIFLELDFSVLRLAPLRDIEF